jgi:hypothetical protein
MRASQIEGFLREALAQARLERLRIADRLALAQQPSGAGLLLKRGDGLFAPAMLRIGGTSSSHCRSKAPPPRRKSEPPAFLASEQSDYTGGGPRTIS